eukprot:TRINITY_DN14874_c0_g2_i1.p1 TRINITY_DN14874_c0_g2~~TRINITY_DN14874_c0_g2_i1.p1  ORF type:complete len:321 (-),score=73.36 TRINITY_DN14874_c0_g2_i1:239-1201(-)
MNIADSTAESASGAATELPASPASENPEDPLSGEKLDFEEAENDQEQKPDNSVEDQFKPQLLDGPTSLFTSSEAAQTAWVAFQEEQHQMAVAGDDDAGGAVEGEVVTAEAMAGAETTASLVQEGVELRSGLDGSAEAGEPMGDSSEATATEQDDESSRNDVGSAPKLVVDLFASNPFTASDPNTTSFDVASSSGSAEVEFSSGAKPADMEMEEADVSPPVAPGDSGSESATSPLAGSAEEGGGAESAGAANPPDAADPPSAAEAPAADGNVGDTERLEGEAPAAEAGQSDESKDQPGGEGESKGSDTGPAQSTVEVSQAS